MNNKLKIYNPDSEFQNEFVKLYPEFANDNKQSEDDMPVKNITFVTTETCNLNCSYCVSGDTLITMSDFSKKRIDEIEIGDEILAFNESSNINNFNSHNKIQLAKVEKIYNHKEKTITIILENGEKLKITKNHKLLARNGKSDWKEAGKFKVGQYVYTAIPVEEYMYNKSKLFKRIKIKEIINNDEEIDVYNIGTTSKTYFANNIAVHNCYETHKSKKMMTKEVAKKAIDAIFDKEKMNGYVTDYNKAVIIEFIGGEPFINIDVMDFICEYFLYKATELNHPWAKYHMFSVTTNGTLLFDEKVMNWIQKYKRKLSLSITIDGNKELHDSCRLFHDGRGSYDIVEKAVKFAIKELGMQSTKVTFAPENINKINTAIPHLFNMGLTDIHANCVFENVWKPEHEPIFYHELLKLADYIIDNDLYETHFCSIFDEMIGAPMDPSDNKNWLISSQI